MTHCANCGTDFSGRFCPNCGTPAAPGAAEPDNTAYSGSATAASTPFTTGSGLSDNVASLLCYVPYVGFIVSILFLLITPYNRLKEVRFNAFQSIFLAVALVIVRIILFIVGSSLHIFGVLGSFSLGALISLLALVLYIYLMVKSYNRERVVLPVVGELALKQA